MDRKPINLSVEMLWRMRDLKCPNQTPNIPQHINISLDLFVKLNMYLMQKLQELKNA